MPGKTAFFDTSAIVPLCIVQETSQRARQLYRRFTKQVVAWTTLIEATGAIHRAIGSGGVTHANAKRGLDRLNQLEGRWTELAADAWVRDTALDLLRTHDLRAGDAIQLASALVWCKEKARHRSFVCFDRKLLAAAESAGFDVIADAE
ncbi:MAG TPA: type II toxin-antitoxin system VapC family toxin [Blastocatellia bacterium]|jgi:predicted nucleic acid-binding protein|nr:type II toxin-antitoxin system VapC family toxin [Blastocatellia bacterium]